jgi:hypothetical protein
MPFDIASTRTRRVRQPDQLEQFAALTLSAGRGDEALVEPEHLVRGVPAGKAEKLGQVSERAPSRRRACGSTANLRLPPRRPDQPARDLDGRRLPGAVRAEDADELAALHLEGDAVERSDAAVPLRDVVCTQGRDHRASLRAGRGTFAACRHPKIGGDVPRNRHIQFRDMRAR